MNAKDLLLYAITDRSWLKDQSLGNNQKCITTPKYPGDAATFTREDSCNFKTRKLEADPTKAPTITSVGKCLPAAIRITPTAVAATKVPPQTSGTYAEFGYFSINQRLLKTATENAVPVCPE